MLSRYRRNGRDFDAILFDGSDESASEICRWFNGYAARHAGQLAIVTNFGLVYTGMGGWVVRDRRSRQLDVVGDREFSAHYELVDEPAAMMSRPERFSGASEHRWDVV